MVSQQCFIQANHSILLYGLVDILILFGTLDIQCHKSIQTPHLLGDWDCDSYLVGLTVSSFCLLLHFSRISNNMLKRKYQKKREENEQNVSVWKGEVRRRVKRNKNSYEIVANEIILTFECIFARDKLFFWQNRNACYELNASSPDTMFGKNIHRRKNAKACERIEGIDGKVREWKRGRAEWNRELSNDPQDTQSACIYVIVYIMLLCWIFIYLAVMWAWEKIARWCEWEVERSQSDLKKAAKRKRRKLIKLKISDWLTMVLSLDLGKHLFVGVCVCIAHSKDFSEVNESCRHTHKDTHTR